MTTLNRTEQQRERLIANVLDFAARRGLPVTIASKLDTLIRVHHHETDEPIYVPLRSLRADHVRCD